MHKAYIYFLFIIFIPSTLNSQNREYEKRAATMRAQVWAWDLPAFKDYSVPEEYSEESAVILACHREIAAEKTSYFREVMKGNNAGRFYYTDINRKMVKINDQSALDKYTEFSFKEENKYYTGGGSISASSLSNNVITILGIRIIKPNGEIREVNIPASSVSVTEGKNNKETFKKVAIPELQKGDIIDYFTAYIHELETARIPAQYIPFYSIDYPTLHYSVRCAFDKKLTVEFRAINGAPSFTQEKDQDGKAILTAQSNHIMRINDIDHLRWVSTLRDFPMIRFIALPKRTATFYQSTRIRPAGIYENVPYTDIIEDAKGYFASHGGRISPDDHIFQKVSDIIENYKLQNTCLTSHELANVIYCALNFEWPSNDDQFYNTGRFLSMLNILLKNNFIECKLGFVTNRYDARKDEILGSWDLYYMITANHDSQYFFPPSRYRVPGEIPYFLQGEFASTIHIDKVVQPATKPWSLQGTEGEIILPTSQAQENASKSELDVSLLPEDLLKLKIKRRSLYKGSQKEDLQPLLLLYEDWDAAIRKYLHIEKSFIEELDEKKATRKYIDEVIASFKRQREEYKETIRKEIYSYHGTEPEKVLTDSIISLGVTVAEPNLIYELAYTMEGFVKKAGNNLILDAGKLIGLQWVPSDNERKRDIDAYLPSKFALEHEIRITIPEGYRVEGAEALNTNYSNYFGAFESMYSIAGNILTIRTKKSYLQPFVPKDKWNVLLEAIDKATDFYSTSIILRKI